MDDFPKYSYADELLSPRELNIGRDGSFEGISRAVAGINYYADTIGFGQSTKFASDAGMQQQPLGVRFFTNTGMKCSNGADMYEYVDTVPSGVVSPRITNEMNAMGLPQLKGLAPGILEDSVSALNPIPLLSAAMGTGYAKCKKIRKPVGDATGRVASRYDPKNVWVKDPYKTEGGLPQQSRWVFDSWISKTEFDATAKTETADGAVKEGFTTLSLKTSQVAATVLLIGLVGAIVLYRR
jgi:hypothetical protein